MKEAEVVAKPVELEAKVATKPAELEAPVQQEVQPSDRRAEKSICEWDLIRAGKTVRRHKHGRNALSPGNE